MGSSGAVVVEEWRSRDGLRAVLLFSKYFDRPLEYVCMEEQDLRVGDWVGVSLDERGRPRDVRWREDALPTRTRGGRVQVSINDIRLKKERGEERYESRDFGPLLVPRAFRARDEEDIIIEWSGSDGDCQWRVVEPDAPRVEEKPSAVGMVKRIGLVGGMSAGNVRYIWSPNGHPLYEGELCIGEGEEEPNLGDWIEFTISVQDDRDVFENRAPRRFRVVDYAIIKPFFPTSLCPNKKSIDLDVKDLFLSAKRLRQWRKESVVVHHELGPVCDRDDRLRSMLPLQPGIAWELHVHVRRVRPRDDKDAPWTLMRIVKAVKVKYEEKPAVQKEHEQSTSSRRDQEMRDGGTREEGLRREKKAGLERHKEGLETRKEGHVKQKEGLEKEVEHLRIEDVPVRREGDPMYTGVLVESRQRDVAYAWLMEPADKGVITRASRRNVAPGDTLYGLFTFKAGRWVADAMDLTVVKPPRELRILKADGRVTVELLASFDAARGMLYNHRFGFIQDIDRQLPRAPLDKEEFRVEIGRMRTGWNVRALL